MSVSAISAIDLSHPDPIPAILTSPDFSKMAKAFAEIPTAKAAVVSPDSQALLYSLIRLLKPENAVEIGTYLASTAKAMALAIAENGVGTLHTVDPYGAETVPGIIASWSFELQRVTQIHLTDSMMFFAWMRQRGMRADLVFVDGDHDYEFALFDIQCAARLMTPGGFMMIDNISQPGPFFAARDFMERASKTGWRECGASLSRLNLTEPFDRYRATIHNTDCCVLRAPRSISIGNRPITFGELNWTTDHTALRLKLVDGAVGTLHVQFVIRIFESPPREIVQSTSSRITAEPEISIPIPFPTLVTEGDRKTVEPWLSWGGEGDLGLKEFPSIC